METSAKTGHAVEEAFLKCSKNILAKIETGELDPERIGSGKSTGRLLTCIIAKDPATDIVTTATKDKIDEQLLVLN